MLATDRSQILQDQLCALRFAGARFARYDDALILAIAFHMRIRIIANCENVWRQFADFALLIKLDLIARIDGQYLIWIDRYQNGAGVCLQ